MRVELLAYAALLSVRVHFTNWREGANLTVMTEQKSRFIPPRIFETTRLQLRPPRVSDAEEVFQCYASDAEVTKYLSWAANKDPRETEGFLRSRVLQWETGSEFMYLLSTRENNKIIGACELRFPDHRAEIGYVLAKEYWRQGFMQEALAAVLGWAKQEQSIWRIWAYCDVENIASAKLLAKMGLKQEGTLKRFMVFPALGTKPRDCLMYGLGR